MAHRGCIPPAVLPGQGTILWNARLASGVTVVLHGGQGWVGKTQAYLKVWASCILPSPSLTGCSCEEMNVCGWSASDLLLLFSLSQ